VQGSDGYFYGTTFADTPSGAETGPGGYGTVFRISTKGILTTLHSFTGGHDGGNPEAGLVQGSDGYFYGTTSVGGAYTNQYGNGLGTVFKISTNGALTTLYSFTGANDGANPSTGLVQAGDGYFYGTTLHGGPDNSGTVFRLAVLPTFQAITLTNGTLSLTWSTEPGVSYQLQYLSDLNSTNWTTLDDPVTGVGGTVTAIDSVTKGSQRFYRLVLLP